MIKRFYVTCIGLSMMGFFALTTVKAMDDLSNIEGKSKPYLSLPPSYENYIRKVGEPAKVVVTNLCRFSSYHFEKRNNRKNIY